MRISHAPSSQQSLPRARAEARDSLKRTLANSESDDEPLTKRARRHGLPSQPHDRTHKAHSLSLPIVTLDPSEGAQASSSKADVDSLPTAGSAGSRDNHTITVSAITEAQSTQKNAVRIVSDDGLYEEDDWVLSPIRPGQSPPYAESASDETEDAHWAELERVHHISPLSPSRPSADFLDKRGGHSSPGGVEPSSPYVPLLDEIHLRKDQTSMRMARRDQRRNSKKSLRATGELSEDSDSDCAFDDTLPPSDDGFLFAASEEVSSPPFAPQRPALRVKTDTSAPDYDIATMSPLTEDSSSARADDSDFVFRSSVTDGPSTSPSPLPSYSKAVSVTPAISGASASATDRVDPAPASVNPVGAAVAAAAVSAAGAPVSDTSKLFGKLAQHDEFYDMRVRNIDGDRVQCNGCSRWMKLKNWERHLKDKCPVYLIQPIKPTPARELLTQKTVVPAMPPRRPRPQAPSPKPPAIEHPAPSADEIFEQIKTDTRVRLVEGEYVQCDACGKWLKIVNWPTHIDSKCGGKKRVRKQYWVYVSDEE